jgi:uncharacterized protein
MNGRLAYLDTSAFVKLVVAEPESGALRRAIARWPERTSATLLRNEAVRALRRSGHDSRLGAARQLLGAMRLVRLDEPLLDRAGELDPRELRSLDAVHLATALAVLAGERVRAGTILDLLGGALDAWLQAAEGRRTVTVRELARRVCLPPAAVIRALQARGLSATLDQAVPRQLAEDVASALGARARRSRPAPRWLAPAAMAVAALGLAAAVRWLLAGDRLPGAAALVLAVGSLLDAAALAARRRPARRGWSDGDDPGGAAVPAWPRPRGPSPLAAVRPLAGRRPPGPAGSDETEGEGQEATARPRFSV